MTATLDTELDSTPSTPMLLNFLISVGSVPVPGLMIHA